jgi:hypothetical protein
MIVWQFIVTGVAERSVGNPKSVVGMSSPGGEDTGEGELNTDLVGRTTRAFSCMAVGMPWRLGVQKPMFHFRPKSKSMAHPAFSLPACCQPLWENFFSLCAPRSPQMPLSTFAWWPCFGRPMRPNSKSTLANPKSTLDLGCEGLIWVENGFMPSLSRGCRHALCPVMTQPSRRSSRTQTAAKRKIYFPKVDSGCEDFLSSQSTLTLATGEALIARKNSHPLVLSEWSCNWHRSPAIAAASGMSKIFNTFR